MIFFARSVGRGRLSQMKTAAEIGGGSRVLICPRSGEAELLKHERLVPLLPSFSHLPVDHTIEYETIEHDRLSRRRRGSERPGMRSRCAPPERHPIPLDQLVFDREV